VFRYVTPIKLGAQNREKIRPDPRNPASWSNAEMRGWVAANSRGRVDPETLCPWESGRQLLRLPEIEFLKR
jgi:kinesin family protein 2/24